MKTLKFNLSILLITISFGCKAQSQSQQINNYNTLIVGTWVEEDDSNLKLIFTDNLSETYYENELLETCSYSIVASNCGDNSESNAIYLKEVNENDSSDITCLEILNITEDSLSLMIIDRGERLFFNKQ